LGANVKYINIKERNISTLVIGGGGYIGSNLVPLLQATGRTVTVIGRKENPAHVLPDGTRYIQGDYGRLDMLRHLLDKHQEVVNLAYATVPNTSFDKPLVDLHENLEPMAQLFIEVAARNRKLLLVSSGGTVYGEAIRIPITEDHPTNPISPYGVTKLSLEKYAYMYSVTHGLNYVCVRPANAYGIGQRPFVGQGFISTAIGYAILGKPISIFGKSGTIRDYIYVEDLAAGIFMALEQGRIGETYNIGSGIGISNLDVVKAILPLMRDIGCNLQIENLPERAFDVKVNILDASKLTIDTNWNVRVNFIDGLTATRDWLITQIK
jgi:UDP-glucose 4-epimerase